MNRNPMKDYDQGEADRPVTGLAIGMSRLPRRPRATHALAWLSLDSPDSFQADIRKRVVWETE